MRISVYGNVIVFDVQGAAKTLRRLDHEIGHLKWTGQFTPRTAPWLTALQNNLPAARKSYADTPGLGQGEALSITGCKETLELLRRELLELVDREGLPPLLYAVYAQLRGDV
jgi:hypothetical protein